MNSISWLLYLIDVISNVKGLTIGAITISVMTGVALFATTLVTEGDCLEWAGYWRIVKWDVALLAVATIVGCVIPSQNTMYAIAASQVGEKLSQTEVVQTLSNDATKALQQWIKRQIADPEAKK